MFIIILVPNFRTEKLRYKLIIFSTLLQISSLCNKLYCKLHCVPKNWDVCVTWSTNGEKYDRRFDIFNRHAF